MQRSTLAPTSRLRQPTQTSRRRAELQAAKSGQQQSAADKENALNSTTTSVASTKTVRGVSARAVNTAGVRGGVKRKSSVDTGGVKAARTTRTTGPTTTTATKARPATATTTASTADAEIPNLPARPTRKNWDIRGRLSDLEEYSASLLTMVRDQWSELRGMREAGAEGERESERRVAEAERKLEEEKERAEALQVRGEEREREREAAEKEAGEWRVKAEERESALDTLKSEHASLQDEASALKTACSEKDCWISDLQSTLNKERETHASALSSLQSNCDSLSLSLSSTQENLSQVSASLQQAEKEIQDLEKERHAAMEERRKLHNTIQELKGNVRVFARFRPSKETLEAGENAGAGPMDHYDFPDSTSGGDSREVVHIGASAVSATGSGTVRPGKRTPFSFDRVFGPNAGQNDVFGEISQLVQSALDGYSVCIFAYGQTGSGKTHTMEGRSNDPGMIPRSVAQVFESAETLRPLGWTFGFEASFVEIYNEALRDLLADAETADTKLEIKLERGGQTGVPGLSVWTVETPERCLELLGRAQKSRAWAATKLNAQSSRSHSVFQLRISGRNEGTDQRVESVLNLVDLAGSERLAQSGATGDRLKETQHINKSLSALGDVISAMASGSQHIPFRNSKLTHLLQNYLGGSSKTLMFVNISPDDEHLGESLNSLRFAAKVNACEIGVAKRKVK